MMINDVRRAYFYASIQRDVYIEVPREDPDAGLDVLGKLELCLYGIRDAAKGLQDELSRHLEGIVFVRGVEPICVLAPHSRYLHDCSRRRVCLERL